MKIIYKLILCLSLIITIMGGFLSVAQADDFGLKTLPHAVILENVPLGRQVKASQLGGPQMKLQIENQGRVVRSFTIEILPVNPKIDIPKQGYLDLPDASWVKPAKSEVRIAGNRTKKVDLLLKIPDKEEYKDKDYQAIIKVKSKKNREEELFVLAVHIPLFFSTRPSIKQVPAAEDSSIDN